MTTLGTVFRGGWHWLLANKEWVFSGVGVALGAALLGWWFSEPAPAPATAPAGINASPGAVVGETITVDVIQTGPGTVKYYKGLGEEQLQALAEEHGVTREVVKRSIGILERNSVAPEDFDRELHKVTRRVATIAAGYGE